MGVMSEKTFDVVVIGLGAVGSAALYQLSKSEASVVGIDQYDPPHAQGSSHGDSRITRLAVGEGAHYVPIVRRSHEIWDELEQRTGEQLLHRVGNTIIATGSGGSHHGADNFIHHVAAFAKEFHIEHELLTHAQLQQRFPVFNFRNGETGYFEPGGGYVLPEKAIATQLRLAESNGAAVIRNTPVTSIKQAGDLVTVTTRSDTFTAKKAIVSVGAWVQQFLPSSHQVFKIERQVLYWFDMARDYEKFKDLPTFVWMFGEGAEEYIYGFPAIDGPNGGLKIATEQHTKTTNPQDFDVSVSRQEVHDMFETHVRQQIPALSNAVVKSAACKYTTTPDHGFVIDTHPRQPNVIVASPCSGHGFKHSAALGEALSQLALDGRSKLDMSQFSFQRLLSSAV